MKESQSTFLGLEITRARKGFEVKNSTDLVESLLNLYGLQHSKPTVNPGRRSTVMEPASATPLDGHDFSNFRTTVGKLIFMAPWRPDMQFAIQQLSTQVLNPTTESKRAGKQLMRNPKRHAQHLSSSRTTHDCPKRFAGTRWSQCLRLGWRFGNTPECYGISLRCTERNNVQPKSDSDCDQAQFL